MARRRPVSRRPVSKRKRKRHMSMGAGILGILGSSAKIGYKLGKDKRYRRMGALGVKGHYKRNPRPWER